MCLGIVLCLFSHDDDDDGCRCRRGFLLLKIVVPLGIVSSTINFGSGRLIWEWPFCGARRGHRPSLLLANIRVYHGQPTIVLFFNRFFWRGC